MEGPGAKGVVSCSGVGKGRRWVQVVVGVRPVPGLERGPEARGPTCRDVQCPDLPSPEGSVGPCESEEVPEDLRPGQSALRHVPRPDPRRRCPPTRPTGTGTEGRPSSPLVHSDRVLVPVFGSGLPKTGVSVSTGLLGVGSGRRLGGRTCFRCWVREES